MKCNETSATYEIKPTDSDYEVKTDLQFILHAYNVNACQQLLESVSEWKKLHASIFLHIVSTQDLDNVIKYFSLTNNYF